ncbi:MAG: NifB/NifX family molybdenum-iron cluster-binding protein [Anaerocolumna sp.]
MKIAVSATGKEKEGLLDRRFGRCEYFLIFDTETGDVKSIGNNGLFSGGGAGIAAASQIIEENISAVITGNLGPNAFELMEKAGIRAYSSDIIPAVKAVELLQKNKLSEINTAVSTHHGMR